MLRIIEYFVAKADFYYIAGVHNGYSVRNLCNHAKVVRDIYYRQAVFFLQPWLLRRAGAFRRRIRADIAYIAFRVRLFQRPKVFLLFFRALRGHANFDAAPALPEFACRRF